MSPAPRARATANSSSSLSSLSLAFKRFRLSPLRQLFAHLVETDSARNQQHEQVIDKIRNLGTQPLAILVLCRDDRLRGFLADLLEYLIEAVVEEVSGIRAFRSIALTA